MEGADNYEVVLDAKFIAREGQCAVNGKPREVGGLEGRAANAQGGRLTMNFNWHSRKLFASTIFR